MQSSKRELRVAVVHWGSRGAGPELTLGTARALQAAGLNVFASISTYVDNAEDWASSGVAILPIRTYRSVREFILRIFTLPWQLFRFRSFLKSHEISIIVSPMYSLWHSAFPSILVGRKRHYVASIHDFTDHPGEEHWLKRWCRGAELRRADLFVCFSEFVEGALSRVVGQPILRLSLPSSPLAQVRSLSDHQETITVGFFGRILPYKGLNLFVNSIDRAHSCDSRIRGLVVGNGDVDQSFFEISAPVEWHLGWADNDAVEDFFRRVDLVVLPYLEASQSGVIAQAFSWGVPVVVTPVGGLRAQVECAGAGLVADAVSVEAISDAIHEVSTCGESYSAMSAAALEYARSAGSWSHYGQTLASTLVRFGVRRRVASSAVALARR